MNRVRKIILRVHGTVIIVLGITLTIVATLGDTYGIGAMVPLPEMPLVVTGLFQTYLLLAVIGVVLWVGSFQAQPRPWNWIGALAHIPLLVSNIVFWNHPPLITNVLFWEHFYQMNMEVMSVAGIIMHSVFIIVEATAAALNKSEFAN